MGELRFELHCEWSVTCVWIMERMVWGVILERVGAERSGWRPNEWIRVETNRQWIDELTVYDNNRSE